jgi:hypothetical protein
MFMIPFIKVVWGELADEIQPSVEVLTYGDRSLRIIRILASRSH